MKYTLYRISDSDLQIVDIKTSRSKRVIVDAFNLLVSALPDVELINKYAFRSGDTNYTWRIGK